MNISEKALKPVQGPIILSGQEVWAEILHLRYSVQRYLWVYATEGQVSLTGGTWRVHGGCTRSIWLGKQLLCNDLHRGHGRTPTFKIHCVRLTRL